MTSLSQLLEGQVALVTGGTRGIGLAVARVLALHGAEVFVNGRSAALDLESPLLLLPFDVTDVNAVRAGFESLFRRSGRLDILVNCAGILRDAVIAMTTDQVAEDLMRVNYFGTFHCCRAGIRLMMRRRAGTIVNLTSIIGCRGMEGYVAYGASKAAVIGLTQSLAKEVASSGIRVNAIAPGLIDTDMTQQLSQRQYGDALARIRMGRAGHTGEVANVALFLASSLSAYVTGQVIGVDGAMMV